MDEADILMCVKHLLLAIASGDQEMVTQQFSCITVAAASFRNELEAVIGDLDFEIEYINGPQPLHRSVSHGKRS